MTVVEGTAYERSHFTWWTTTLQGHFFDKPIPCHMLFHQPSANYFSLHHDNLACTQQTFFSEMFDFLYLCGGVKCRMLHNSTCNFKVLCHAVHMDLCMCSAWLMKANEMSQYHRRHYVLTYPVCRSMHTTLIAYSRTLWLAATVLKEDIFKGRIILKKSISLCIHKS